MALPLEGAITPVSIADIGVELIDGADSTESIRYTVQVAFDDGKIYARTGNLAPHLTAGQITALRNFMAALRTQAESEMIP